MEWSTMMMKNELYEIDKKRKKKQVILRGKGN